MIHFLKQQMGCCCCCRIIGVCWLEIINDKYHFELLWVRNGIVIKQSNSEGSLHFLGVLYKQLDKFSEDQVLGVSRVRNRITSLVQKLQEEHDKKQGGTYQNPAYVSLLENEDNI